VVTPEGNIHLPPIGTIPVAGLNTSEARKAVAERVAPMFKFFDLTFTVLSARSFEVSVSGEVEKPGTYPVSAIDRILQVLTAAGGVTPLGSIRRITLLREGTGERTLGLLRFSLKGDLSQNPHVSEGVSIVVPPKGPSISLQGSVGRPGEYELLDDRSLTGLLSLTGGVSPQAALKEARLTRVGSDNRKETLSLDLDAALRPEAPAFELQGGDLLYVPSLAVLQDQVEVRGAFFGPGFDPAKGAPPTAKSSIVNRVELASGERIRDIILKAGGVAPWADFPKAFVERVSPQDGKQILPVDLNRLLVEKDESQNIALRNGDLFVVPVADDKVYVVGNVKSPGAFDYRPFFGPKDYMVLAGGPDDRAKLKAATVTFRDVREFPLEASPPLEPGAIVRVPPVFLKFPQDYVPIVFTMASLITAVTGVFILFGLTAAPSPLFPVESQ
jgi:protein involved in polysaccharide export with SLBB domain